jgi:hypothetical protein
LPQGAPTAFRGCLVGHSVIGDHSVICDRSGPDTFICTRRPAVPDRVGELDGSIPSHPRVGPDCKHKTWCQVRSGLFFTIRI